MKPKPPRKFKLYRARFDSLRGGAPYMECLDAYQDEGVISFTIGEYAYTSRPAGFYDTPEQALQAYILHYSQVYRERIAKLKEEIVELQQNTGELLCIRVESCKESR